MNPAEAFLAEVEVNEQDIHPVATVRLLRSVPRMRRALQAALTMQRNLHLDDGWSRALDAVRSVIEDELGSGGEEQ